jgi:phage protein D
MGLFYASYAVIMAGQDVTSKFDPHLLSVKITRASGEAADTCDLDLSDQNGDIVMPGERAPTQVMIDGLLAFTGFVSDVTYAFAKGSGSKLSLSCSSIDQGSKVKEPTLKYKDDASLSDFASELGSAAGLAVTVAGSIADIQRPYWLSQNESFMSWGQRIAKDIGASFKILGTNAYLVALNEGISPSGKPLTPISAVRGQNLISGSISPIISRPKFKDVEVSYFDVKKGERVKQKVPTGVSDVDSSLRTVIGAANEDQAKNKAEAHGKNSDRDKGSGSVVILGEVAAEPEAMCMISGTRPGVDGGYRIGTVTHTISKGSGFETSLDLKQPQDGAGTDSR